MWTRQFFPDQARANPNAAGPAASAPGAAPGAPPAGNPSFDYSSDPILQKIKAISGQSRDNARAEAGNLRRQTAIDFGDEGIARQVGDESTVAAAAGNPFSYLARLNRDGQEATRQTEQNYGGNLFFSGARGNALGQLGQNLIERQADVTGQGRARLGEIEANLLAAEQFASAQEMQAEEDAAQRAIEQALAIGAVPTVAPGEAAVLDPGGYGAPDPVASVIAPPQGNADPGLLAYPGIGGFGGATSFDDPMAALLGSALTVGGRRRRTLAEELLDY